MKKLAISIAITAALGLTGCDDTTLEDVQSEVADIQQQQEQIAAAATVVFDPAAGILSVPNDLLFNGTADFTLELPAETDAKAAGEAVDFTNPEAVLGALDGWGVQNSFSIAIDYDEGVSLDETTVASSDAVAIYHVKNYPINGDENCSDSSMALMACEGVSQLTWGVDYVTSVSGGNIVVTPVKPFAAGQSYIVALTKAIKDNQGDSLQPSSSYSSLVLDITTHPLATDDQLALQAIYNSYENVLARDFGAVPDDIVYTAAFTTQSAGVPATDPLQIVKQLNGAVFAETAAADPNAIVTVAAPVGVNVGTAIGLAITDEDPSGYLLFASGDLYSATIDVPYYLETFATGNPVSGRWEAQCDSGVALATLTADQITALEATVPEENAASHALCQSIGLANYGIDTERHLTKYNPLPVTKSTETIDVQVTLPNVTAANTFWAAAGVEKTISKPEAGWPVVMLQHGITSRKEDSLGITGWLSANGFATVAIDHPVHGARSFEIPNEDGTGSGNYVSASSDRDGLMNYPGNSATFYLNLENLMNGRDNLRQSAADGLKLRLALNAFYDGADGSVAVDPSQVYYSGHSLGAMTGTNMMAVANTPTGNDALDALYNIKAGVLANPGSSIANFLLESGSFSPLVISSVNYGAGTEVSALIQANIENISEVLAANLASETPSDACSSVFADVSAAAAPSDTEVLICAYDEFYANATAEQMAIVSATNQEFAFAAQAAVEAGDATNYAQLLVSTQTPVLMFEIAGDGGDNLPDQTIPNSLTTDPFNMIAGTTGLANQLGLPQISETTQAEEGSTVSGIVRYKVGNHGTFGNPADTSGIHTEMQTMMYTFFATQGMTIPVTSTGTCVIVGDTAENCSE